VILRMPDRGVRAAVVALPGAGDGRARQPLFEQIGRSLSVMDVAVLSYTRRTVDEGDTPIAVQAAHAIGAMRALKGRLQCPVGLFGFSQGAWAATVAAADDAAGFLVVLGCSGVSPAEQMRFYTDELLRRRGFDERDRTRSRDLRLRFEKFRRRARPGASERERLAAALRDAPRESWFPYACLPDSPPPEGRGWSDMDFDPAPTFGTALLDVRVLPWRPRARVMKADAIRENVDPFVAVDDLHGLVVGLAVWVAIIIAAPLIVLVLAVGLLSVELPLVAALAVILVVVRFAGLIPWQVLIVDRVTGEERRERYRSLWGALRRISAVNSDRRIKVRWAWT
jgi:hypothetical protein